MLWGAGLWLPTWGMDVGIDIQSDASAAMGICRRKGLGTVRHIAVADWWVQERLHASDLTLVKIAGETNPEDKLTKHIDRPLLDRLLPLAGLELQRGMATSAPTLTHALVDTSLVKRRWSLKN